MRIGTRLGREEAPFDGRVRLTPLLAVLVLGLAGCSSVGTNRLNLVSDSLQRARTLEVRVTGPHGHSFVRKEIHEGLKRCRPNLELVESGPADVTIEWHDDTGESICLDYWEPRCDAQVAIATVSDETFSAHWARSLPGSCWEQDCLLKLFVRDLQRVACKENR